MHDPIQPGETLRSIDQAEALTATEAATLGEIQGNHAPTAERATPPPPQPATLANLAGLTYRGNSLLVCLPWLLQSE